MTASLVDVEVTIWKEKNQEVVQELLALVVEDAPVRFPQHQILGQEQPV